MTSKCPSTPLHPDANQEIETPATKIPQELTSALDLGSDSEDDGSNIMHDAHLAKVISKTGGPELSEEEDEMDNNDSLMDSDDLERLDPEVMDAMAPMGEPLSPRPSPSSSDSASGVASSGFFDTDTQKRRTPLNPFGGNSQLASSEPIRIIRKKSRSQGASKPLSMKQQSRLVTYIDERLMEIQRRFIKYLSAREDPDNEPESTATQFGFSDLAEALDKVITIIWYSIFQVKVVPFVYHYNILTPSEAAVLGYNEGKEVVLEEITPDFLFGQTNYFIRIMGDLVDYVEKFEFVHFDSIHNLLLLFAKLDNIISILIDEYSEDNGPSRTNNQPFINNTEKIRIDSIISRTKLLVIQKFDVFKKISLYESVDENGKRKQIESDIKKDIQKYELLIGEIYEGILDRTSI
ncbi:hypothetical protein FOA43_000388 [Brettanomyces nanus]|uniref:Uncharacterized protein n=1 Tax=Eeniella nana TaxID=13502 RepID=A0A875RX32_EENNA|nr:uncharacterized protein FOA43_000388 [Brettanomyces nanus]QPG73083.1 hypothetical protein FOA43_000388 [Brettanomyces nanus]